MCFPNMKELCTLPHLQPHAGAQVSLGLLKGALERGKKQSPGGHASAWGDTATLIQGPGRWVRCLHSGTHQVASDPGPWLRVALHKIVYRATKGFLRNDVPFLKH